MYMCVCMCVWGGDTLVACHTRITVQVWAIVERGTIDTWFQGQEGPPPPLSLPLSLSPSLSRSLSRALSLYLCVCVCVCVCVAAPTVVVAVGQ